MICLADNAGYRVLHHPPKQLEIVELKLEFYREKERKTKPRHESRMIGLQTSKYMIRSRAGRASHMGEVDEGKQRENPSKIFNNQGF